MTEPFNNNASQKERREFVKDSYHNRYQDEAGGRFAQVNKSTVSGKDPTTLYPKIPAGPWSANYAQVPPEEPLNIDVNEPVVTGERFEVEASQQPFSWMRERSLGSKSSLGSAGTSELSIGLAGPPTDPANTCTPVCIGGGEAGDGAATPTGDRGRRAPSSKSILRRLV